MNSYNTFAKYYDLLTENVDYKVRSDYISNFFYEYGKGLGSVLDLACGTGNIGLCLKEQGYDVIGIDLSEDMLTIAQSKNSDITYIKADMTDFKLNNRVDYCVCSLDSINHLPSIEAVKKCFDCVNTALNEDGIFIFDVNTIYKHNNILDNNTFVFDEEEFFLSWDNENIGDNTIRILLDFFIFNGESYDRYSEEFYEKAYEIKELVSILDSFEILGIYDELTKEAPKEDSERVYFVCKRK